MKSIAIGKKFPFLSNPNPRCTRAESYPAHIVRGRVGTVGRLKPRNHVSPPVSGAKLLAMAAAAAAGGATRERKEQSREESGWGGMP